jgi:excisionase family DNA binding protein
MKRPVEVTPREAAQKLGIRLHHLYSLLWDGSLTARKVDGRWLVSATSVEERLRKRLSGETL